MEIKSIVCALGQVLAETSAEQSTEVYFINGARAQNSGDFTPIFMAGLTRKKFAENGILINGILPSWQIGFHFVTASRVLNSV